MKVQHAFTRIHTDISPTWGPQVATYDPNDRIAAR